MLSRRLMTLALVAGLGLAGSARAAEPELPAASWGRLEALGEASALIWKNPLLGRAPFLKAARECLWDTHDKVVKRGVKALAEFGDYYCREELAAFTYKFERLPQDKSIPYQKAYDLCRDALREMDLRGTFAVLKEGNILYVKRRPEYQVPFLLSIYWGDCLSGETPEWVVRRLALVNHETAENALLEIQRYVAWQSKNQQTGGYWKSELPAVIARALRLNALVRKADSVAGGVEAALISDDLAMIRLAAEGALRQDVDEHGKGLLASFDKAIAKYAAMYEKFQKDDKKRNLAEDTLKVLKPARAELNEKVSPPPKNPDAQ